MSPGSWEKSLSISTSTSNPRWRPHLKPSRYALPRPDLRGGLSGYAIVNVQCQGPCTTPKGVGSLTGAVIAAGGVAVVAVLVLRAMGEWRRIQEEEQRQQEGGEGP